MKIKKKRLMALVKGVSAQESCLIQYFDNADCERMNDCIVCKYADPKEAEKKLAKYLKGK